MSSDIQSNIKVFKLISNITEIDWSRISIKSRLTETFIRENAEFLDWSMISRYQRLSIQIVIDYADKVDWYYIIKRKLVPKEIYEKYKHLFDNKTLELFGD